MLSCESAGQAVQLLGDAAIFSHEVTTVVRTRAGDDTVRERETIVFRRRRDGGWAAVHEHLSPRPEQGRGVSTVVACCQLAPELGEPAANRELAAAAIEDAVAQGASVIVLPELMSSGYVFESQGRGASLR